MNQPIIPASVALQINERVRNMIDQRLFMFCNYEPTPSYALSNDGLFAAAIQDLYKFFIDSNCVLSHYTDLLTPDQCKQFTLLDSLLENIRTLRFVYDHNQSPDNGLIEQSRVDWYHRWIAQSLGKAFPEDDDDFKLLYLKLLSISNQLITQVKSLLTVIESLPTMEREELADKWLKITLNWYSNTVKRDVYMGHLESIYIANVASKGKDTSYSSDSKVMTRKAKKWIQAALVEDLTQKKSTIHQHTNVVNHLSTCSAEEQANIEKRLGNSIQDVISMFTKEIERLTFQCSKIDNATTSISESFRYFFDNLPDQLRETVSRLDKDHVDYTILPQDLMLFDIDYYFKGVASPEGDF